MEYIKQGLSNWTNPSGRSSRAEYWSTFIAFNLLALILIFVNEALYSLLLLFSLFVGISLGIRRMHDAGVSGWFILIPLVNFVYAFSKSEQKENKWGPVPSESKINTTQTDTNAETYTITESEQPPQNNNIELDDEIEALETRLIELQELKKEKNNLKDEEDKRKKEILEEIEKLKNELNE
tara:strand:+ start:170 stop:712 length:543 start_codon:yes stop_codon:yes gene_type:complete